MMNDLKNPLAAIIDNFNGWSLITAYLRNNCEVPQRRLRTEENLQRWLDSGLIEAVAFKPEFNRFVVMSDAEIEKYIWLRPTDLGLACHYLYSQLNDQKHATKQAFIDGKKQAFVILAHDMASKLGIGYCQTSDND